MMALLAETRQLARISQFFKGIIMRKFEAGAFYLLAAIYCACVILAWLSVS